VPRRCGLPLFGSYSFGKEQRFKKLNGLNLGLNFYFETGLPINKFDPHPVYLNAGEAGNQI